MKFIGHLDVMRFFQKMMRRAEIPIAFTGGFSPHMIMSFANPLGVGVTSDGEYFDIELTEEIDMNEAVARMNQTSVEGIEVVNMVPISEKKKRTGMTIVAAADYFSTVKYGTFPEGWQQMAAGFMNQPSICIVKKTKKSEKEVDIKPMIFEIKYWIKDNSLVLNLLLRSGSREHLSADLVVKYIKMHTTNVKDAFVDIRREEMYFYKQEKLEPLYNCR